MKVTINGTEFEQTETADVWQIKAMYERITGNALGEEFTMKIDYTEDKMPEKKHKANDDDTSPHSFPKMKKTDKPFNG